MARAVPLDTSLKRRREELSRHISRPLSNWAMCPAFSFGRRTPRLDISSKPATHQSDCRRYGNAEAPGSEMFACSCRCSTPHLRPPTRRHRDFHFHHAARTRDRTSERRVQPRVPHRLRLLVAHLSRLHASLNRQSLIKVFSAAAPCKTLALPIRIFSFIIIGCDSSTPPPLSNSGRACRFNQASPVRRLKKGDFPHPQEQLAPFLCSARVRFVDSSRDGAQQRRNVPGAATSRRR